MAGFRLDGRVAIVTGAGSERGLGRAIADALHAAGAAVALADVDLEGARRNAGRLGERALAVEMDVTDQGSVDAAVAEVAGTLGPAAILVNNAGITAPTPLLELGVDEFDRLLAINLRGGFLCLKAVLPAMVEARFGRLIWISSVAGRQGGGIIGTAHYAASKAGVIGLCQAAARELGRHGITSNALAPGLILTGIADRAAGAGAEERAEAQIRAASPLGRAGRPEEVAAAAVFLASQEAGYITGEVLDVNGGIYYD